MGLAGTVASAVSAEVALAKTVAEFTGGALTLNGRACPRRIALFEFLFDSVPAVKANPAIAWAIRAILTRIADAVGVAGAILRAVVMVFLQLGFTDAIAAMTIREALNGVFALIGLTDPVVVTGVAIHGAKSLAQRIVLTKVHIANAISTVVAPRFIESTLGGSGGGIRANKARNDVTSATTITADFAIVWRAVIAFLASRRLSVPATGAAIIGAGKGGTITP
jgi:hypothetical protein